MKCNYLLLYIAAYFGAISYSNGQNLIPDPSFDALTSEECIWPNEVFQSSLHWYVANPTPDWHINGCPPHPNAPFVGIQAGRGSIGMRMDLRLRGFHYSEAIGTALSEPMEADRLYYFEMEVTNRGVAIRGEGPFSFDCLLTPEKDIRVYTAPDSIFFVLDDDDGTVNTNASPLFIFQEDFLASYQESFPTTMGRCLQGDPSVRHLAVAPRFGSFDIEPPCIVIDSLGFFAIVYFEMDDINLEALPERIDTSILLCSTDADPLVDLRSVFDERALESVTYTWADGTEGPVRTLTEAGTYDASINLDCGSIPISVALAFEVCQPEVFVPNAFSPNQDGFNDSFGPFIEVDFPTVEYSFQVYDRWGALLFESNELTDTWNGDALGSIAGVGVYVWVLEYTIEGPSGEQRFREMGDVLLVR
ncbi:MAG: gliding motility-associated C-terminal domain-containing protein [Bacteroidota bacterium]